MADMMKMMGGAKKGGLGKMAQMFGMGGAMGGGMPEPSPAELEAMAKQLGGGKAGGLGGMPPMPPGFGSSLGAKLPSNLPGLGGPRLPGLGGCGFNPFGGKKK